jgi:hypothetical protein
MGRISLFALMGLLLVAWTLRAQDTPAVPNAEFVPKPAPVVVPRGRITGTVLCADTRRPARGAMVMVLPLPSADAKEQPGQTVLARVAMDGTFVAERLGPGEYTVIALLPGYLSALDSMMASQLEGPSPEKERAILEKNGTVVVHGAETATRDIVLARGAAVSGRVLYSDGSPATQITILVEDAKAKPPASGSTPGQVNEGKAFLAMMTHQSSGTDDQGHFRIAGLPPGSYRVAAVQIGGASMDVGDGFASAMAGMPDPASMRFYSGDTMRKSAAKVYELRSGDEVADITITIPDTLLHQVRGSLSAIGGGTITAATVTLKDSAEDGLSFSTPVAQGDTFTFPQVPAGTYTLTVTGAESRHFVNGPMQEDGEPPKQPPPTLFVDESKTVIVKDGDITDANFTLKEVAHADSGKAPGTATSPPR